MGGGRLSAALSDLHASDRRRLAGDQQTIAPVAQLLDGQKGNRLGEQPGRKQFPDAARIDGRAIACRQVAFVDVERLRHSRRAIAGDILAADQDAGFVLSFPEGENRRAVSGLVIVRKSDGVGPVGTVTIGSAQHPLARPLVAAVANCESRCDSREVIGLFARLHLQSCGAVFERRGSNAAGHGNSCVPGSVSNMCAGQDGHAWTIIDTSA